MLFVLPAHPNPMVRRTLLPALEGIDNVRVVEPLDYRDFAGLLARAELVITDSGGIQEEAPSLGIPVLVLREITERAEGVAAGVVELVGTNEERIVARAEAKLAATTAGAPRNRALTSQRPIVSPYGDGRAAARSAAAIARMLGAGAPPQEWDSGVVAVDPTSTCDTIDDDPPFGALSLNLHRLSR